MIFDICFCALYSLSCIAAFGSGLWVLQPSFRSVWFGVLFGRCCWGGISPAEKHKVEMAKT
jgi:hypothetical protein